VTVLVRSAPRERAPPLGAIPSCFGIVPSQVPFSSVLATLLPLSDQRPSIEFSVPYRGPFDFHPVRTLALSIGRIVQGAPARPGLLCIQGPCRAEA
jgi:hypothetical protein